MRPRVWLLLVAAWLVVLVFFVAFGLDSQFKDPVEDFWLGLAAGMALGLTIAHISGQVARSREDE